MRGCVSLPIASGGLNPWFFIAVTLPLLVPLFCTLRIGISDYFYHILRNNWFVCMCELKEGD